jgi:cytochrome c oxidase cbb3-type subunit 3
MRLQSTALNDSFMKGFSAMNIRVILTALLLVIGCSSWVAAQAVRGNPQTGQVVYEKNCLRCHGEKLDGNGPDGRDLIVQPTNLQSITSRSKTDWELLITISHGAAFTPMHGFRGKLTDQQLMDVLAYVRMMAPFDALS